MVMVVMEVVMVVVLLAKWWVVVVVVALVAAVMVMVTVGVIEKQCAHKRCGESAVASNHRKIHSYVSLGRRRKQTNKQTKIHRRQKRSE
jgi:hypothetical protein